ncbi:heterokaryon incompatibility protein-domain-containing protein, partial [Massariosphaeria phaeospora]
MEKCLFCAALYKSGMSIGDSSDDATPWPLYHWTLRIAPRGRELQSSMVLSFRFKHARIPSKSFRVLPEASLNVPSINQVSKFTDPALSGGSQIKAWIESCNNDHSGCSKTSSSTWVPTRLLDLESGDPNKVRLVDTRVSRIKGPYCTLSHAWGKITITITTVWNMAQFLLDGIPLSDLSNTFRQAIEVARFLKIRYIWIDSLCIVQQPYGDFAKEGDLMHKVYRYSYCNLVATDSINGQGGLFRERGPSAVLPVKYHGRGTNRAFREESWVIVPADIWEEELLSSFIYTRGWVFQERMLSPRLLHFSKNQIFWDCGTLSACETFPSGLPFSLDHKAGTDRHWRGRLDQPDQSSADITGPNDNESPYTFWRSAVESYTVCNLTSQTDKTVAIWSVAKLLRDITDEGYAVGMWATELEEQLAWRVEDVQGSERVPELQLNIPSWSWASVKGHIIPHHRLVTRDYRVTNHQGDDISFAVETQAN